MNFVEFKQSLQGSVPPKGLSVYLNALWYDGKKEWKKAHDLVDSLPGKEAASVHAYLHRVEGDEWNANYWYTRAGEKMPSCSLEQEWELLVNRFI